MFVASLLVPIAAGAQYIDLPGTQPGDLATATPLDSPRSCGVACHFSFDATVPSAMPYDGWLGSMMGNTMRDPLFLAALTVADQDRPGIGDWCLRCHTPPGFVGGRTRGPPSASRGMNLESDDQDGVTCDSCHRMLPTTNLGNAQYVISPTDTRFGPYPVIDSIRHPGEASTWLADPRMCGSCHEVTNPTQPLRRADGTDTGQRFPLDTSYSEWSRSAFAASGSTDPRTCQDCHLPRIAGQGHVASNTTAMLRNRPRRHDFAGANAWAIRVLGAMRADITSGDFYDPDAAPFYEASARRSETLLRGAVTLELRELPSSAAAGASVAFVARITNLAGHRVPTGFADGRRVWLAVDLIDADGRVIPISGAYDNATAHLDESDSQFRSYEAHHGRAGTGREDHIALHDTIVSDTRLPPRGYRPLPGHEPVGRDYAGGEGGALRHWDDARYVVSIPAAARGTVTIRVRARFQATTREYVEFLVAQNRTDDRGRELQRRYEASGRAAPFDMAEATGQIAVETPAPDAGVDTGDSGPTADGPTMDSGTGRPPGGCGCRVGQRGGELAGALWVLALVATRRRRRVRDLTC